MLSNEFMNVWTHLLGLFYALFELFRLNYFAPEVNARADFNDRLLLSLYLLSVVVCGIVLALAMSDVILIVPT